jgi:hypothetical protein
MQSAAAVVKSTNRFRNGQIVRRNPAVFKVEKYLPARLEHFERKAAAAPWKKRLRAIKIAIRHSWPKLSPCSNSFGPAHFGTTF